MAQWVLVFFFLFRFSFLVPCLAMDIPAQSNAKKKKEVGPYPFILTKHTCWFSNSCIVCHTSSFAFLYHISNTNQWIVSQTNSLSVPGWVWTTLYFSYLLLLENACLCCQRSSRFLRYSENSWQFGQGKSLTAWEAYLLPCIPTITTTFVVSWKLP